MCTPHAFQPAPAQMAAVRRGRRATGISRRDLLRAAGVGAAALAIGPAALAGRGPLSGLLGSQALAQALTEAGICIPAEQLSIQLYTMAETMAEDFPGTVQALADIGYRVVEHAGTDASEDGSAESFRAAFDAVGIGITSGHRGVPYPYSEEDWQAVLDECEALGATRINEPLPLFLLPDLIAARGGATVGTTTSVQYGQYADALNQAAAAAAARGIRVGYHNHNPEFLALPDSPGQTGYDVLLAETDPALVDFEMDVYWVTAGGLDPVELLQRHEGRFGQLHIKDMAEDGTITFPGTGIIDFAAIVAEGARQGIAEYIVEQDNADAEGVRAAELGHQLLSAGCALPGGPEVRRVAGEGRAETAAALSALTSGGGVAVAYVAGGAGFADALAAGPAAGAEGGPLLLVDRDAVPAATRAELARLRPGRIVIVGGPSAVSDAVAAELGDLTEGDVTRRAGADRYASAAAAAEAFAPGVQRVVVATGEAFPDALAGATAAAGGPVLLTRPDDLPAVTRQALERLAPAAITVVGGTSAVSEGVVEQLQAIAPTTRVAGTTRYETAAAASEAVTGTGGTVLVATGEDFPDAVAASAAVAGAQASGGAVLLVQRDALPAATRQALARLAPRRVLVLGGTSAVDDGVVEQIRAALA